MLDGSFEIEIVENVDAHRSERQFMKRDPDGRRKARGHHVIRPVASDGRTRNPWDPTQTPGGSSGGEAAALASV